MRKSEMERIVSEGNTMQLISRAITGTDGEAIVKVLSERKLFNKVETVAESAKKASVRKAALAELIKGKDWYNITKVARFTPYSEIAERALEALIAAKRWKFVEEIADFGNTEFGGEKLKVRASGVLKKVGFSG